MESTMHFLDGNDPSRTPGAIALFPGLDPHIVWESSEEGTEKRRVVVDTLTGERFAFQITEPEYRKFLGIIRHHDEREEVWVNGYFGQYDRPGFGKLVAYSVEFTGKPPFAGVPRLTSTYPLARIATFLNHLGSPYGPKNTVGHVVVIGMPDQESSEL